MSLLPTDDDFDGVPDADIDYVTRDYLLLTIFVLVQHGYYKRAAILAEALAHNGDRGIDLVFARMVVRFFSRDWSGAITLAEELERRDPVERFGRFELTDRQKMRRYVRLRCLHELGETAHVRDAIEIYLRHGEVTGDEPE